MISSNDFLKNQKSDRSFVAPWERIGIDVTEARTIKQVAKIAGLDYQVAKLPNQHHLPSGNIIVSEESFYTFRKDNETILGPRLGKNYHPLQNTEALSILDDLVKKGGMKPIKAGVLEGGAVAFVVCKQPNQIVVSENDLVDQYIVLVNGHDGKVPICAFFMNVREICTNGLQLFECTSKYKIRHTESAKDRLAAAMKIMGITTKNADKMQVVYNELAQINIGTRTFQEYLGNVFFDDHEIKNLQGGRSYEDVISARKRNVLSAVANFSENGIGQAEARPGSAWWAYNAITGYFHHQAPYRSDEARFEHLVWSESNKVMEKALYLAKEPNRIKSLGSSFSVN